MDNELDIAALMRASVPSQEQLAQWERERVIRRQNPTGREALLRNTTRLSKWLERCQASGVEAVPAVFSEPIPIEQIFNACDAIGPNPSLEAACRWLNQNLKPGLMWRWDQCAPLDLKSIMAHGGSPAERVDLSVDDPRFIDILYEVNVGYTNIAVRPIVEALRHNGFPVEFRCYVFGPAEVAVSNYYPQVSLPEAFEAPARKAAELALKLHAATGTAFSADFLLKPSGDLIFLEGGPPWGAGAHPCCYNPDKLVPGRVLLAPEEGNVIDD